jgi:hypothetical protein
MEVEPWTSFTCGGKSIFLAAVPLCSIGQYVHQVYWLFVRYEGSSCLRKKSCAGNELPFKPLENLMFSSV